MLGLLARPPTLLNTVVWPPLLLNTVDLVQPMLNILIKLFLLQ